MNIWIVNHYAIPPNMGGLVRHYYFSKYLHEKGDEVKIFTSGLIHNTDINMVDNNLLYSEKYIDDVLYTFVKSKKYHGNGLDRIFNLIDFPFKIWKTMATFYKKNKPDIIYTSSPDIFVAFFALLFGKKHKLPVIVEVRDLWPESIVEYNNMSRRNPIIQILYKLEKWIYKAADQLIFTMEGGKDYICDKGWEKSLKKKKVNHINNGVDLAEYEKDIKTWEYADKDLDNESLFKVVYVGSVRHANNIQTLVDAARVLKNRNEMSIRIVIFGDGTDKASLEKQCIEEGLDNIVFKGKIDKKYIPNILSKSNLNLLNYRQASTWKYGGSQNKQFEYLASGRPICSNVSMGYSIIKSNHCGIEECIETAERYADIIVYYKNMPQYEYKQQCENAKNAAKRYDYHILTDELEKVIEKCFNRREIQ